MASLDNTAHLMPALGDAAAVRPDFLKVLLALGREQKLDAGQDLFRQGDAADALYLLIEGALEISVLSSEGRKLTLNFLRPGAILGEIAVFDHGARSATVTAIEASIAWHVDSTAFEAEVRANPDFAVEMIRFCVERLRRVNAHFEDHVFHSLNIRLARRLLHLLETAGKGPVVPMSQAALADYVGATREAVAKVLGT